MGETPVVEDGRGWVSREAGAKGSGFDMSEETGKRTGSTARWIGAMRAWA